MPPPIPSARPAPSRPSPNDVYTFTTLRPLAHLPNPSRALEYLERIRSDRGVRAVMRRYKWTVPVLAEMEPVGNTDARSRTLGRNHGGGALIEVRLRTDAYDGFRDYRTVRKTIAHELAHNVHAEHDSRFWELCTRLTNEIERDDWASAGRPLTDQVFYEPPPPPARTSLQDHGTTWNGGTHLLGGAAARVSAPTSAGDAAGRRELMARAAEERLKKTTTGQQTAAG